MPFALGVRAWVEVDGQPLPEYKTQVDQRRTTCFIPSQEGKRFCVRFQNVEPPVMALRGNIFLDGIAAGSGLLLATDLHATSLSGQTRLEGLECPFQFAKLRTTDDESEACQDENRLRELGTIRVQIEWVDIVRQEAWRQSLSTPPSADEPIFERSKKAGAHCTTFGHLEVSRRKNWYSTRRVPFVDPIDFIFQYAPQDWLIAKEIAPATYTSSSRSAKRDRGTSNEADDSEATIDDLLDDEEAAVYQRLKAKIAGHQNKKRRKVVKREPHEAPSRLSKPEIIDLTGED